jgi:hypothetical protein
MRSISAVTSLFLTNQIAGSARGNKTNVINRQIRQKVEKIGARF